MTATTDAPTTLAVAELDASGTRDLPLPPGRRRRRPALSAEARGRALAMRPAALHVGTLGLVLEPMAEVLAAASRGPTIGRCSCSTRTAARSAIRDRAALPSSGSAPSSPAATSSRPAWTTWPTSSRVSPRPTRPVGCSTVVRPAVVLTDGARPVRIATRRGTVEVPVPPVEVVDTVGCRRRVRRRVPRSLDRAGWGRAELATRTDFATPSLRRRASRPPPAVGWGPTRLAARRGDRRAWSFAQRLPCRRAAPLPSTRPGRLRVPAAGRLDGRRRGVRQGAFPEPEPRATAAPTSGPSRASSAPTASRSPPMPSSATRPRTRSRHSRPRTGCRPMGSSATRPGSS